MATACAHADVQRVYRTRALGTVAELVVNDGGVLLTGASELLEDELARIDRVASRFRSDSELSRLNAKAGTGAATEVSADLLEAIDVALAMAAATGGLVDPTVGLAMSRLGYDRDFADVRPGVDGDLPPAQAVPGWRSVAVDRQRRRRAPRRGHGARPRRDRQGPGGGPGCRDHLRPARVWGTRARWVVTWPRRAPAPAGGFAVGIADTCTSPHPAEAVSILLGRVGLVGRRGAPVAPRGAPGPPHPRSGHRPLRGPVLAHRLGDGGQLRAGERRLDGRHRPRGVRRRLAGGPRAPGAARAARRDGGADKGMASASAPSARAGTPGGGAAMMAALVATVGHGSTALWYLTRATGLVSLILLSATVVLGTVASVGWTTDRWPRFLSQSVHRNLSLFCLALIAIHVVSTVGDGYVPIGLADAVIPFRSPYRPVWVGLGALAFDLLLAVALTSALRRRIGVAVWRGVHWLAYACWPIAVVHGLGSGSDARLPGATLVFVACTGSVAAAVAWRLVAGQRPYGGLAARRSARCRRGPPGHHRLRRGRPAPAGLVAPGGHVLGLARPAGRRIRHVVRRLHSRPDHTFDGTAGDLRDPRHAVLRPRCRGRSRPRRPTHAASPRSPSRCTWPTRRRPSRSASSARP